MAFYVAGFIVALSLGLGLVGLLADGMSDTPGQNSGVAPIVIGGLIVAALVAGSHWLPQIGW